MWMLRGNLLLLLICQTKCCTLISVWPVLEVPYNSQGITMSVPVERVDSSLFSFWELLEIGLGPLGEVH